MSAKSDNQRVQLLLQSEVRGALNRSRRVKGGDAPGLRVPGDRPRRMDRVSDASGGEFGELCRFDAQISCSVTEPGRDGVHTAADATTGRSNTRDAA